MYHLPAYLALERWVLARTVVVVQPSGPEGPRRLLAAGARQVLVIGGDFGSEPGMEVRPSSGSRLPLRDESVDLVVCIEAFGALRSTDRRELLRESHRVLRAEGILCAWIEQRESEAFGRTLAGSSQLDFWALEEHIAAIFPRVDMLAQMPWQGFSLAPILDEQTAMRVGEAEEPQLSLREDLLAEPPEASHFLAIASKSRVPPGLARECLLIPLPRNEVFGFDPQAERDGVEIDELRDELDRLREELSLRAAKVASAHGRVRELESQLENLRARSSEVEIAEVERLRDALTEAETQISIFRAREQEQGSALARIEDDRADLLHELEVVRREQSHRGASAAEVEGELSELRRELEAQRGREREAREKLRAQDTDLQILTRTSAEQDKAVERLTTQLEVERKAIEEARATDRSLRERLEQLDGERQELRRQTEVYVAEREGARKLAQRVEAELDVANRRARQQEQTLAGKIEEASRLAGELEGLRKRLDEADKALAQTRSRAEELSATAAQGAEQGRMLADVALDRDRLREELSQRARQVEDLEGRLWEARETLQKERLEAVRVGGEVERLREQLERSRAEETKRIKEVEQLGRELRTLEVEKAEANALLRARDEQLQRMERDAEAVAGQSEDVDDLRAQLRTRNEELARIGDQLAQAQAREERASAQAVKRERELQDSVDRIGRLQRDIDGQATLAADLQNEVDVRQVEIEQLAASVANLQNELEEAKERAKLREQEREVLQRELEEAGAARESLRRQLKLREDELEQLTSAQESRSLELSQLRRELEASSDLGELDVGEGVGEDELASWPEPARLEIRRLRTAMANQAREHARELAKVRETAAASAKPAHSADAERLRRLRLEIQVRSAEQEQMLGQLDGAEQKIWEMTDAADRNAARFAASLAQLEKHKETVDSLLDELEVTRNLLSAEQARALEQERLLASERAKMARAGIGIEGFPTVDPADDDPFADPFKDLERDMVDLGPSPAPVKFHGPPAASSTSTPDKPASVTRASAPPRKPGTGSRPTANELDQALATLTDDDETSFADLNDELDKPAKPSTRVGSGPIAVTRVGSGPIRVDPDAPVARPRRGSSSGVQAAAMESGIPGEVHDVHGSRGSKPLKLDPRSSTGKARVTVEEVDDDEWPDEP
ncbi:methyltransferase domain-containing protein [Nannocystaceae bacterium ST9]